MGRDSYSFRLTVEECQSISTVSLNRNNLFNRGIHDTTITWTGWRTERGSIGLIVSMFKGNEHCRLYYTQTDRFSGQKTDLNYTVKLVSTPCYFGGNRWWFICPLVRVVEKRATAGLRFSIWVEKSTSGAGIAIILLMISKRKVTNLINCLKVWGMTRRRQEEHYLERGVTDVRSLKTFSEKPKKV